MIDNRTLQAELNKRVVPTIAVDGIAGPGTAAAIVRLLDKAKVVHKAWGPDRKRIAAEQLIMRDAGQAVGKIDGVIGPQFQSALERYQDARRAADSKAKAPTTPAAPAKEQFPLERDMEAFYGKPGTNHVRITAPYPLFYGDQPVKSFLINARCANSAMRAMQRILDHYGPERIHELGIDRFSGCFNDRAKRGGTSKSVHAYAAAIDWDAARNQLRETHRTARFARPEYKAFLDAWEAEGWISLGRARDYDWMHVQAARF